MQHRIMKKELIYVRVLEQDTCDQIKMGQAFPIWKDKLQTVVENTKTQYGQRFEWCGGFDAGCEKYQQRIAIVDAYTFQSLCEIYNRKGGK